VSDVHLNGMWQLGFKRKIKFVSFKVQHPDCNILDQSGNFLGEKLCQLVKENRPYLDKLGAIF